MAASKKHDEQLPSNHSSELPPSPGDVTQCPHCHEHMTEIEMLKHLEHCHRWMSTYKSPDGSIQTTSYVGSNQASLSLANHADQIFQGGMTEHDERCPQHHRATALQGIERPIHHQGLNQNNNRVSNQFPAVATSCSRCGDLHNLVNKIRHAEQCQKVDVTFQAANGTSGSISYAGPNDNLVKRIRQAAAGEYNNKLNQH